MTSELRSVDRLQALAREEWITKFVNTVTRELRLGLDRMAVVTAAREECARSQGDDPRQAAHDWARRAASNQ